VNFARGNTIYPYNNTTVFQPYPLGVEVIIFYKDFSNLINPLPRQQDEAESGPGPGRAGIVINTEKDLAGREGA
jgi:hypothetical protein